MALNHPSLISLVPIGCIGNHVIRQSPAVVPAGGVAPLPPARSRRGRPPAATHHGRVVVAARRRGAVERALGPRLLLDVETQQVVEHGAPVVAAEHVDAVLVGHHGVLTASGGREWSRFNVTH